jgi:hypothetical protein
MNTSKKTNTKKILLIAMALCFMLPAMAQKTSDKTAFEQLKKKVKEVEQINRRAGSYTQKIDSTVYSTGTKDVLQYDENFNCTKWSSYYYDELSQYIEYEYDAQNRVVSQTTIYPYGNSGFKTTMEYDVAGNLTLQTGYTKQDEEWVEISRMIMEYDAVGNLTSETSYGKQNGEWVAQGLDTYEYDSEGHVLFMHEYYMNSTTGDWDEFYYDVHNYTNGLHTEFIAYMTNYEGGFIPHRRITWDYNEQQWCVREEYWDWYQDGGGELAYWILANRYDIVYFDNGNVKERISNMVDWVTGDAFPYEKTVYAYDEHNNVTSTNSYAYTFDTSEWSLLFSTVMEYDQSVSVDNIAGFALLFGETTSDYWSSGESTSPYKDKLLKITNFVWWEEEDEVQDVYYSTTTNSPAYVDLGLPSGTLWATCNVGADTPEGYGDYFAWGETQPKDTYNWSTYQYCMGSSNTLTKYCNNSSYGYNGFTDDLTTLLPEDDAATINWSNGWRMPTQAEFQELIDNTTAIWMTQNDVNGYLFTASNGNSLFLPATGFRLNSNLYFPGGEGDYWSSSLSAYPSSAWYFYFDSDGYNMGHGHDRYCGRSVRPVRSSSGPSHTTQTIELSAGWNWFSSNVEITLNDLKTALVEAVPSTSITIKSQSNGSTSYNGNTWRGALNSLDVSQMYMIKVNTSCEITLTGTPINPAEHPVTIYHGVNWIAFPLSQSMTLNNTFAGFAVSGDKVKSQTTTGNYNGSLWRPSFSLEPGKGYMYISNTQGTRIFIFPASSK